MSSSDFDSIFCRFAENIFYNPEQEIFKNQDYLQMRTIDTQKAEHLRAIFCQYLPYDSRYFEQYPKSEIFNTMLRKVITDRITADDFINEFVDRISTISHSI